MSELADDEVFKRFALGFVEHYFTMNRGSTFTVYQDSKENLYFQNDGLNERENELLSALPPSWPLAIIYNLPSEDGSLRQLSDRKDLF